MTRTIPTLAVLAVAAAAVFAALPRAEAGGEARVVPPYAAAAAPAAKPAASETAILAGGCFWGVQGVFQHVKGVSSAVSGYAGGAQNTASYHMVGSGMTGHAEAVEVTFDPRQVSYAQLLQIYFSVVHDPTELNRQGPDRGTQYRSTVFAASDEQAAIARAYIAQLDAAKVWSKPVATTVERGRAFYPAEEYHQDFLVRNPSYPYIVVNDQPKVVDLKRLFPDAWRPEPVLALKDGAAKPSKTAAS